MSPGATAMPVAPTPAGAQLALPSPVAVQVLAGRSSGLSFTTAHDAAVRQLQLEAVRPGARLQCISVVMQSFAADAFP